MSAASAGAMLRLLGPVELTAAPGTAVGPPRQRLVLAALAADAGRLVALDALVDRVWGTEPPPRAHRTLHAYIARTRRMLAPLPAGASGPVGIELGGGGYRLRIDPDRVDLHRFRGLVAAARAQARTPPQRLELLREAARLWVGTPLSGLDGAWVHRVRQSWQQEQVTAAVAWAAVELEVGDPAAVLAPLDDLAADHPLDEALAAAVMRVLARLGGTGEALHRYRETRARLVTELGVEPGPELAEVHRAVLRGDSGRPARTVAPAAASQSAVGAGGPDPRPADSAAPGPVPPHPPAPAQLPLNLPVFAGRSREVGTLDALAATHARTTVLAVLSGPAGVGKTALAVHWAHRVAARYPDGQLFVNLGAFGPPGHAVETTDAVRRFLDALDVPPERIPPDPDAQAALYRSTIAGRRMLIVLDNARSAAQVRGLLPGAPRCAVLVTSRHQLTGLVAVDGGHPVPVQLLTAVDADQLLARRLGRPRLAAEPDAVREIVDRCDRLPLALAIVAAHAAMHPGQPLAGLAAALRDTGGRLDALAGADDPSTDARAVFSWSYRDLAPPAARLFRLLGLHPGPQISVTAAASLTGQPPAAVRDLLARLVDAHLVAEPAAGRYALHDLLHAYAADLTRRLDGSTRRDAALRRVLDHYLHTAYAADRLLDPTRPPRRLGPPGRGVAADTFTDRDAAIGWLAAEQPALLAVVRLARDTGLDAYTTRLTLAVADFLDRRGHWRDLDEILTAAVTAAARTGDVEAEVESRRLLARAYNRLGRGADAHAQLRAVLELTERSGDRAGQARAHHNLAMVWERHRDYTTALHYVSRALTLYRAVGDERGAALALNGVGWCHAQLGDDRAARDTCEQALIELRRLGDPAAEADGWDSLAIIYSHLGRHREAVAHGRRAVEILHGLGHRYREADSLEHLGEVLEAAGDTTAAREVWQAAFDVLTALGHADTDRLRGRLNRTGPPVGAPGAVVNPPQAAHPGR